MDSRNSFASLDEREPIHHEPNQLTLPFDPRAAAAERDRRRAAKVLAAELEAEARGRAAFRARLAGAGLVERQSHPLGYAAKMILQFLDVAGGPVSPFDVAIDCLPRYSTGLVDSILADLYAAELVDLTAMGATLTDAGRRAIGGGL